MQIPKNWRTTASGMVAAGIYAAAAYFNNGGVDWQAAAAAAGIAAIGWFAKDAGVSGVEK